MMPCARSLLALTIGALHATADDAIPVSTLHIDFPSGVVVERSMRYGETGSPAVTLLLGDSSIDARVADLDGDSFFVVHRGEAFCKIDVGIDAGASGLFAEVYQQHRLQCKVVSSHGGLTKEGAENYTLHMTADLTEDSGTECDSSTDTACTTRWRSTKTYEPEWAAHIDFPQGVVLRRTQRNGDYGWGVDRNISGHSVDVGVWDDDGDAYFSVQMGQGLCKVSVGSNGLGPGLEVEVYEQQGLECKVASSSGGPSKFALQMTADEARGHAVDCGAATTVACPTAWRAPITVVV